MTHLIVENAVTSAKELKSVSYELPSYDVGYEVTYQSKGLDIEAVIVGFRLDVFIGVDDELCTQVTYDLDNGDAVLEDEITFYAEPM